MRKPIVLVLLLGLALAQQAVPPPKQPQEPAALYRLEVVILRGDKPVAGITGYLGRFAAGGRLLQPANLRSLEPVTRISSSEGRMSWNELSPQDLVLQLRDPSTGLALTLPLEEDFVAAPLQLGPYRIQLKLEARPGQ